MDEDAGAEGISSRSECEDYSENNEISSEFEDAESDATNAFSTNGTQFTEIISVSLVANILKKAVIGADVPSARKEFNRPKVNNSSESINRLVRHTIQKYNLRKSAISGIISYDNLFNLSLPEVRKTLEDMISAESNLNAYHDTGACSKRLPTSTETIVRLLEDAIKDVQNKTNCTERADANIESDVIINDSLNQISQKFTLNGRQDIAFEIAGSYLLDSFKKSLLKLDPG